ncbi:ATP-binding protein [Lentzea sp. NPDC060358]|uniref:ATP-binding protein n=1 Tax=Lentzea sp. NPDC060358 TaxID=3347103 RepID=UPI00366698AE
MTQQDDRRLAGEVESYLRQLMDVAAAAGRTSEPMAVAEALAEAQRVTAWGLRSAVELGRAHGLSWRELADVLSVPASTLHRQYSSGAAIVTAHDSAAPPVTVPPDRSGEPQPGGPPAALDRFVGRRRELTEVPDLLWRRRLVSIVGPAGVGKTRLAGEIAALVRNDYRGGVWWVRLSSVTREWLIGPAVSAAAALAGAGKHPRQVVAEATGAGPVLLVLDNCEHLLGGAADITVQLREAAPELRILTTSREALRAPGEVLVPLAPFPSARGTGRGARIADAVRLFAERARDVRQDFDIDAHLDAVAEICDRLDGLPLAIELAARQSDILSPHLLLRALAEPLDVLVDAQRGTLDRHHSLRGAIRWSFDLLDSKTREVFACLCLLPGGFDQHTAAAVASGLDLTRSQLWALLADLTRKSMIVTDPHVPGRFRILESLRAFGLEVLTAAGALTSAQERLIDWLALGERQLADNPWGDEHTLLMNRIVAECDNVRYAADAAAALSHPEHLKVALLLARILTTRMEMTETSKILLDVLASPLASPADQATAHWMMAVNAGRTGDHATARRHADDATAVARRLDDVTVLTMALSALMITRGLVDDAAGGAEVGAELIDRLRAEGNIGSLGRVLSIQAWLLVADGDADAAHRTISEAIALHEGQADQSLPLAARFANEWGTTLLHVAAIVAIERGDDATAADYVEAILTTDFQHHNAVSGALKCAAILAARRGENERSLRLSSGAARVGFVLDSFGNDQLDAATDAARSAVGPARAAAAVAMGQSMTVDQLKAHAINGALPTDDRPADVLTPSQRQVALCVARGLTNAQIALALSMSERTVASHLTHIRTKLDLTSRVEVAMWITRATGADGTTVERDSPARRRRR